MRRRRDRSERNKPANPYTAPRPAPNPAYSYPPPQPPDPYGQPASPVGETQAVPPPVYVPVDRRRRRGRRGLDWERPRRAFGWGCGCLPSAMLALLVGLVLLIYLLAPLRTNILLLGIDYAPANSWTGRSDTVILATVVPLQPYVGMLSIPRDLWVSIPGIGENRINTAHFFAEAAQAGSGPQAALNTIRADFGVDVGYYLRIRFDGVREVANAMGGVDVDLPEPMAGYPAGRVHLTGNKALAFARHRAGADDFFRMEQGQILIKSMLRQMLNPLKWPRLPAVLGAFSRSVDTNIPVWVWPRLGFALLRAGPGGIDSRTITREMAPSFQTADGASVLSPDWSQINPVLMEMFEQ